MLTAQTKSKINSARDILVGKIPDPKGQIDQITNALIYKFMDDQDRTAQSLPGGKPSFFIGEVADYAWHKLFDKKLTNQDRANLYIDGLQKLSQSTHLPNLFKSIFKEAYLTFRDAGTIVMFLDKINEFDYNHSEELGNAFEYLLSVMGSQGDAGQFRTPRHIIKFIVDILQPQPHETVIDPACGTAGFLVEAYNYIASNNNLTQSQKAILANNLTGVDIDPGMAKIARVNLYLHGFKTPKITEDDTLTNPALWGTKYDVILANPPFMTPKGGIKPHDKFVKANKAEVLFTDYISEHLKLEGRAGIVVPEGIIFQSATAYKSLRKKLIDDNYLLAVISLPSGVFQPYSGVKTSILILDRARAKKSDSILFIKVSNDGFDLSAQRRENTKNDLPEALRLIEEFSVEATTVSPLTQSASELVQVVTKSKLRESGDYNLSGDRYKATTDYTNSKYPMVELGDVVKDMHQGVNTAADKVEFTNQGFPIIQAKDITSGRLNLGETKTLSNADFTKYKEKYKPQINNLLLSNIGTVGKTVVINKEEDFIIAWNVFILKLKENILPTYLKCCLEKFDNDNYWDQFMTGGTVKFINKKTISNTKIPLPPLSVQQQIVDEISGYQKIIDGAKQITQNWKPKIDIDPSWEMVKLGDVFVLSSGKFLPKSQLIEGDFPVYGGNGINGYHNEYFVEEPTITFGRVGEYCGAVHITKPKSWISDNTLYIKKFLIKQNEIYLATYLGIFNFNRFAKKGGQPSISQDTIYSQSIPLPTLPIQNEIVERIEHERKLVDSTKELITIYEAKIKSVIAKVWADVEE